MTHDFALHHPGMYVDSHGCHLYDDGHQIRIYWRTRYDAHLSRALLAACQAAPSPMTTELGGALTVADSYPTSQEVSMTRTLYRTLWILILATSLGGLAPRALAAKPKQAPQPSPAPLTHLTDHEQACQLLGTLAHAVTVDRDNSVSLLTTLDRLRTILRVAPDLLGMVERLTIVIYSDTRRLASPGQVRQAAELGCLFPDTEKGPTWERR